MVSTSVKPRADSWPPGVFFRLCVGAEFFMCNGW
jgi:hypothetical protein